jgi:deoxyribonuclease IV
VKKKTVLLGAHMSIEGGFHKALERGGSIGCTAIQIFTKSNRQWHAKPITEEEALLFKKTLKKTTISYVMAHASYLINLASDKEETRNKAISALIIELERCHLLGIPHLVLHPGSHIKQGEDVGLLHIIAGINSALKDSKNKTMILLETMAGQGSSLGTTFEQLATIRKGVAQKERIGVCLDTCHIFAAGYSFRSEKEYKDLWKNFNDTIGINHLKAIHMNDSKKEYNSRVDRHEDIGKGQIGNKGFSFLMNDSALDHVPKILETPKENPEDDLRNMERLNNLISP